MALVDKLVIAGRGGGGVGPGQGRSKTACEERDAREYNRTLLYGRIIQAMRRDTNREGGGVLGTDDLY